MVFPAYSFQLQMFVFLAHGPETFTVIYSHFRGNIDHSRYVHDTSDVAWYFSRLAPNVMDDAR